jgi:hypothetical protein|tara:strand:- start:1134 stop:1313 length:180 start_codon:yes stop_codon:yes gene_type:complete
VYVFRLGDHQQDDVERENEEPFSSHVFHNARLLLAKREDLHEEKNRRRAYSDARFCALK